MTNNNEPTSLFLRACRGLPTERPPVWLMRQAGRYMPEYRAIREKHSMLEVIHTPELAAQVTLQPIDRFGFDAAIIFSDILPPLIGMGLKLDFVKGEGPAIENPIRRARDVDVLAAPPAEEHMAGTLRAIELVSRELAGRDIPLIGFAGAPFTLASYAIEGGGTSNYARVKSFMYAEPAAWKRLMTKLVTVQVDYLLKQVKAGAAALQLFDSWAGQALGQPDYLRYVQPYNKMLFGAIAKAGVPVINFSPYTGGYLLDAVACGGDVIGLDWRMPLDWAWRQIGYERPVQGNLDPIALLAPWRELAARIDDVLDQAAGRPGHIFNLGHGILPMTPVENVERLVARVKEGRTQNAERKTVSQAARPVQPPVGVLIMAYGGPDALDEIPGYLADIRAGRPTTPAVLAEITHNYAQIGGKSPLLPISQKQMAAVQARLDPERFRCYLGMRHWSPWIEEVVGQMLADGVTHAISLVLAPHFSKLSVAKYQEKIADGLAMYGGQIEFAHIASYHDAPKLIQALANRVQDGLCRWPAAERANVHVIFSAHSLPERILKMGDPYDQQLRETARMVAEQAGLRAGQWSWSYQSAGRSPEPWLGPQIEEHIADLAEQGVKDIVSIPVGFVCDHVEILYDIDIKGQGVARELGVRLERPPALNDDPLYIETLAELIQRGAARWG